VVGWGLPLQSANPCLHHSGEDCDCRRTVLHPERHRPQQADAVRDHGD